MNNIHPTAIIDPAAELGDNISIGPYCIVGAGVKLGDGVRLVGHCVVDGDTTVGAGCEIHPFARIGGLTQDLKYKNTNKTYAEIGENTVLREYVTINRGTRDGEVTRVGSNTLLMAYCHVAHGCNIGNGVIVSNGTQFAGEVMVEDKATVSGLIGVHQFCRNGTLSMTGSRTVSQDIPPYMLVQGFDSIVTGINVVGLTRRGFSEECRRLLHQAYRFLYHEKMNFGAACEKIESELPHTPELVHLVEFYRTTKRGVVR